MFVHEGRDDLPDLDLEVSSLHEAAVSAFVQQGGFEGLSRPHRDDEFPRLRTLRVGVHVSLGARQAVRSVGAALGMEPPRVNSVARQVPLLSSPGAIENVMTHAPELGIPDAGAGVEPYNTLVRVAGQLEGIPHRYGAHPSAYTFSCYGPGALAWLPAQWVSDGRPGRRRPFGAARHLAVVAQERAQAAQPGAPGGRRRPTCSRRAGRSTPTAMRPRPATERQRRPGHRPAVGQGRPRGARPGAPGHQPVRRDGHRGHRGPSTSRRSGHRPRPGGCSRPATRCRSARSRRSACACCSSGRASWPSCNRSGGRALQSIEDLAQLLALWKPGAYNKEREQAYFDARFAARERPTYPASCHGGGPRPDVRPGALRRPAGRAGEAAGLRPRLGGALPSLARRRSLRRPARRDGARHPRGRRAPPVVGRAEQRADRPAAAARRLPAPARPRAGHGAARLSPGVPEGQPVDHGAASSPKC